MKSPKRIVCLCVFSLFLSLNLLADWNSFVINYNKSLYGKGAQTWQIAGYNDNWVYFANQKGMLQFDGNSWNVFPLNNGSDVRSVLPSSLRKRIYVGGINEFGYFEPAFDGKLSYVCLSDSLRGDDREIGNVWGIHESDDILYLQGEGKVLKFLNGKYVTLHSNWRIDCSYMVNGILYVGTENGVWVVVGNTFFPLQGAEALASERIRGIIPHGKGIIIATAYNGLFYYSENKITPFFTGAEEFMSRNEIFCAAFSPGLIALGTVHNGILLIDKRTMQVKYFNESNGLQNNTVLSLNFDSLNNLWAGLDSGIDYVCLNSPLTNLYSHSYGTGYSALLADDYLYLGTNRGLYYTHFPVRMSEGQTRIYSVPNSSGQVWNICRVGDDLFCLHDRGLFLIEKASMTRISDIVGAWTCQPVLGTTDKMYVGVYGGLYLMEKKNGEWKKVCKIDGLPESSRFFEQESARIIWVSGLNKVVRVELDETLTKVLNLNLYDAHKGLPFKREVYVCKVDAKICFTTPGGIYRYNKVKDCIEPDEELNKLLNGSCPYSRLVTYKERLISLNHREICISDLYKPYNYHATIPIENSSVELVDGAETIVPIADSLFVIPNDNGFALCKIPSLYAQTDYSKSVHIRRVYLSSPKDSLVYTDNFLGRKDEIEVPYSQNAVRFEYGLSLFTYGGDVSYQYRLNQQEWSDFTNLKVKEYSNLPEGEYTFEVKAVFPDGSTSVDAYTFKILPPWYRTGVAYVCYILLILFVFWGIYRWDDIRVKRKKEQAVVEKDKELHEMEKEYEEEKARNERQIMQLEKEKLEHDLKYKSQEMANLMINFVRKNEMLTEIKSDLFKVISVLRGENSKEPKQMLLVVNNKIDSNIQSDDVLKRIEEQFDLVHNNFMKRLGEKHPDLSLNERMMCAYLKMDLSSKEIAPLLNISVRGVETVRYRLRKKFGLEREESLMDYLNKKL